MIAFTGPDSLRIEVASIEVGHLHVLNTLPGVIPLLAAARNGTGAARLTSSRDGTYLSWRAPGSTVDGPAVRCAADGNYLLRDDIDPGKWLRIQVDSSELASGARMTVVELANRFNNAVASDDVSAAEATAGDVETWTLTLVNQGNAILSQLKVWIDPATPNLAIADDGATWVSPTTKPAALELPDLAVSGTDTLHVQRTITAGAGSHTGILNHLHFCYRG